MNAKNKLLKGLYVFFYSNISPIHSLKAKEKCLSKQNQKQTPA
jgi:hypothetical protein